MESDNLKFQRNKKRYKMSLLFIQTKEIQRLYNSELENSPKNYFLVSKEWLDNYKKENDYEYTTNMFDSFNDWENYADFKQKISKRFDINKNNFTVFKVEDALENIFNFSLKKIVIKDCNLGFPADCELVKEEFFKDCSNGSVGFPLYEVFIGNKLIIIKDSETQNLVFLCSLIESEENKYNSLVKVNYVLAFENEIYMKNELKEIISNSNNINNYFSQRKIDTNINESQNINNPDGKKLGILFIIKDNQLIQGNNQLMQGNNQLMQGNNQLIQGNNQLNQNISNQSNGLNYNNNQIQNNFNNNLNNNNLNIENNKSNGTIQIGNEMNQNQILRATKNNNLNKENMNNLNNNNSNYINQNNNINNIVNNNNIYNNRNNDIINNRNNDINNDLNNNLNINLINNRNNDNNNNFYVNNVDINNSNNLNNNINYNQQNTNNFNNNNLTNYNNNYNNKNQNNFNINKRENIFNSNNGNYFQNTTTMVSNNMNNNLE